jgi:hypothetical protein
VRPLVCLQSSGEESFSAEFSYDNSSGAAVIIEPGERNRLEPPMDVSLPRVFVPGEARFAFSVTTSEPQVTWFLDGNSAVASRQSPPCAQDS